MVTIVNVGYRSTNYWVISVRRSRMLIDLGWPGMFGRLRANLRRMDMPLGEIKYGLATHYHIDHAGTAQELREAGVELIVIDLQLDSIPLMKQFTKPQDNYLEIDMASLAPWTLEESRARLAEIGLHGQIVHTPGHSDDSVSMLLDTGEVFTGDLTPMSAATDDQKALVQSSWDRLRELGAKLVHPGHGPIAELEAYASADGVRGA